MEKRVKKVDFWVLTIHIIRNTFSLVETGYYTPYIFYNFDELLYFLFIHNPSKQIFIFSEFVKIHKTKIRILEYLNL